MSTIRRRPTKRAQESLPALRSETLQQVRKLISTLSHSARAVERRTGVTNAQLFLLQQLAGENPLSVHALAARARTQTSTVSIVIARLVRAGLAATRKSSDDRRLTLVSLTPKGRRLLRHAPTPPTSALLSAIEMLAAPDIHALYAGVRALLRSLELSPTEATMLFEHAPKRRSTPTRPRGTATRSPKRKP